MGRATAVERRRTSRSFAANTKLERGVSVAVPVEQADFVSIPRATWLALLPRIATSSDCPMPPERQRARGTHRHAGFLERKREGPATRHQQSRRAE
jgi:hypothetical protein